MRVLKRITAIGVGFGVLAVSGVATAAVPAPVTIGKTRSGHAPQVLVDSKGTVNVLWTNTDAAGLAYTRYSRKPAGAKSFTQVDLPGMPSTSGGFLYAPSPGALEVIVTVNGPLSLAAWTSSNDGASWTQLPTTPQMAKRGANGLYLQAPGMFEAPGGPLDYAGSDGETGPIVQLDPAISQPTPVGTNLVSGVILQHIGQNAAGTVFTLGASGGDNGTATSAVFPFQAGTVTGSVTFPCGGAAAVAGTDHTMAVGKSAAVVAFAGCGHIWAQTINAAGAVGPLTTIGTSPGASTGALGGRNGEAWVGVTANPNGSFTAAYTVPGNDVGVARSSDGIHWKLAAGLVPTQGSAPGYAGDLSLAQGSADWLGLVGAAGNDSSLQQVMPLSETYRRPTPPAGGHHASLGSLAVSVPAKISKKTFGKTGKATVKLVDTLGATVATSISVTRTQGNATLQVCSGGGKAKLKAGKVKKVVLPCANGAIVIGAIVDTKPLVKKGDLVTFEFTGRNGQVTVQSKIAN